MRTLKKNNNYEKIKILYLVILSILIISCDKDEILKEDDSISKNGDSLELKFEVKTEQDQMGDFALNAMTI